MCPAPGPECQQRAGRRARSRGTGRRAEPPGTCAPRSPPGSGRRREPSGGHRPAGTGWGASVPAAGRDCDPGCGLLGPWVVPVRPGGRGHPGHGPSTARALPSPRPLRAPSLFRRPPLTGAAPRAFGGPVCHVHCRFTSPVPLLLGREEPS